MIGNTPDISDFLEYTWYEPIWYYKHSIFPEENKYLAYWIGIANKVGQAMCYWVLPASGIPLARTTIQKLSKDELETGSVKSALSILRSSIEEKFNSPDIQLLTFQLYREDVPEDNDDNEHFQPEALQPEQDDIEPDIYDELLLAEPVLQQDGVYARAKIIGRKRDANGNLIGSYNPNPLLNTRIYLTSFPNGHVAKFSANLISESIYNNISEDGTDELFFNAIIGHEQTPISTEQQVNESDTSIHFTTKGWKICIAWKDGTSSWHPLSEVKSSYPLEPSQYAHENNLHYLPAFNWWVKSTLKHRHSFIKATKTCFLKRTHKFGIRVPKSIQEALTIDRETCTTFWRDAIHKEMENCRVAFKILDEDEAAPVGFKFIRCHMIFNVKMDFTRKARFIAGGHMMDSPSSITYSSVESRDSIRLAFLNAALNDVNVLACDIGNAYLNATPREKVYTKAGLEFGAEMQGRNVLIVRALYGLKSSGAAWRSHLANTLQHLGFTSSLADPDVWYRSAVKPDGFTYYEYVLVMWMIY